nr:hypothetical protein [Rickettsia tamurae]
MYFCGGVAAWVLNRHCEQALLRGPVKPTVSPSSLNHGVHKNNKKY